MPTRTEQLEQVFQTQPTYRMEQAKAALFDPKQSGWEAVSVLPKALRSEVAAALPWMSLSEERVLGSRRQDTFKALLKTHDGKFIETVLMRNARDWWSICVSSQVGCAMACTFCATGKMGFTRNLSSDEIVDQYRYWMYFLERHPELPQRISNVVYMGMGEPLANYDAVKHSLQTLLLYTDMGPTRLTVSTVGLIPMLRKLLRDAEWPPVRLAVSLHSAEGKTRSAIMPSSYPHFLDDLAQWTKEYFDKFGSRRRHLTFEYVMLAGVNDTPLHAKHLIAFASKIGKVKVNLIPYNDTKSQYASSRERALLEFAERLKRSGIDVTRRRTMGDDIAAACGQLSTQESKSKSV